MTQHNHPTLRLEELGERTQPGAVPLTAAPPLADAITAASVANLLAGLGQGTFTNPVTANALSVDALTTYNLKGTANLAGLGNVTVTGAVHSVGFVLTGEATGQITFTNAKGSVTLQLTGPLQQGFAPLPTTFHYTVVAHTGAYAHLTESGSLSLAVTPAVVNYIPQSQGTFAISI